LEDLDGVAWGPAPEDATGLVKRVHELRRRQIRKLSPEDMRVLIGQEVGLDPLIPVALELLQDDPLLEAGLYPGDLLVAVLGVEQDYWDKRPALAAQIERTLDSIEHPPIELASDIKTFRDLRA
jgi:hypothetical protein